MAEYLEELAAVSKYSMGDYLDNFFVRRTAERLLQLIVETATDINGHLIIEDGHSPPKDYFSSFIKLGELGMIDQRLAERLAPSAGLRNRLVYEYEEVDNEIVFVSMSTAIKHYREYIEAIEEIL